MKTKTPRGPQSLQRGVGEASLYKTLHRAVRTEGPRVICFALAMVLMDLGYGDDGRLLAMIARRLAKKQPMEAGKS